MALTYAQSFIREGLGPPGVSQRGKDNPAREPAYPGDWPIGITFLDYVLDTAMVYGGRGFGYNYDPIGNRTSASETIGGETLVKNYVANELNQYTAIANPVAVGLRGTATNTAVVTVNGEAASSDTVASDVRPWHFALSADNADGGAYTFASIMAVVNPAGTNTPDIVSTASGSVYAPPRNETPTYDDDGNLLSDGRWQYTWNGENRLVCAKEKTRDRPQNPPLSAGSNQKAGQLIEFLWGRAGEKQLTQFALIHPSDTWAVFRDTTEPDTSGDTSGQP